MSDSPCQGYLTQTAHGRTSYEIDADSGFLFKLATVLVSQFGFQAEGKPLDGIDVIYWDFTRGGVRLTAGWDVWSGCFVFATAPSGDTIVQEIGHYLDTRLHDL